MDEVNKIIKEYRSQVISRNKLAHKYNRSWETVNNIVSIPPEQLKNRGKTRRGRKSIITSELLQRIEKELQEEIENNVWRKQRFTATSLLHKFIEEGVYKNSSRSFMEAVRVTRLKLAQTKVKSYLPLEFEFGKALQVDHGEAKIKIDGNELKGYLFVASIPGHKIRYCQIYPVKSQEAWGEFHKNMFIFFGGVFSKIFYDNDSVLVKKIIGDDRNRTTFSLALDDYFKFDSIFCNPASGWEKGSVENAVGYTRRNFLTGIPEYNSFKELNLYLEKKSTEDINNKSQFDELKDILNPISEKKTWSVNNSFKVNKCQLIKINEHEYSVPEKYVGCYVEVKKSIWKITIHHDGELIAEHERCYFSNKHSLKLSHYLTQLIKKPSALWNCRALNKDELPKALLKLWDKLNHKYGYKKANYNLIKILFLRNKVKESEWSFSIEMGLELNAIDASSIENLCYQAVEETYNNSPIEIKLLKDKFSHLLKNTNDLKFDLKIYDSLRGGVNYA